MSLSIHGGAALARTAGHRLPGRGEPIRRRLDEQRTHLGRIMAALYRTLPTPPTAAPPPLSLLPLAGDPSWYLLREPKYIDAGAAAALAQALADEAARIVDIARQFCRIVRGCCGGEQAEPDGDRLEDVRFGGWATSP